MQASPSRCQGKSGLCGHHMEDMRRQWYVPKLRLGQQLGTTIGAGSHSLTIHIQFPKLWVERHCWSVNDSCCQQPFGQPVALLCRVQLHRTTAAVKLTVSQQGCSKLLARCAAKQCIKGTITVNACCNMRSLYIELPAPIGWSMPHCLALCPHGMMGAANLCKSRPGDIGRDAKACHLQTFQMPKGVHLSLSISSDDHLPCSAELAQSLSTADCAAAVGAVPVLRAIHVI